MRTKTIGRKKPAISERVKKVKLILDKLEEISVDDKILVLRKLKAATLKQRFSKLKSMIPDLDISEEEVMKEVKAVRDKRYVK